VPKTNLAASQFKT